jgi:hypothetical protein
VAGDLNRDQGVELTNAKDQFSGRANIQVNPLSNLDIAVNAGYTESETALSCEGGCGGTMWTSVFSTPAHLPDNRCSWAPGYGCDFWGGFRSGPPEFYNERDLEQNIDRFTGSIQINYRPVSWLTNRLTVGTDVTQRA